MSSRHVIEAATKPGVTSVDLDIVWPDSQPGKPEPTMASITAATARWAARFGCTAEALPAGPNGPEFRFSGTEENLFKLCLNYAKQGGGDETDARYYMHRDEA